MPVKVGVVGAGIFGVNHLNAFRQLSYLGVAELAAVAEVNEKRAKWVEENYGCPVYRDYNEMFAKPDIDAVTVVTPDHLHKPIVLAAAAAGKHVLVEKPLDVTVEGCQAMIDAAKKANVLLQVDFHKRYDPEHIAMERRVSSGEFGKVLYGSVLHGGPHRGARATGSRTGRRRRARGGSWGSTSTTSCAGSSSPTARPSSPRAARSCCTNEYGVDT